MPLIKTFCIHDTCTFIIGPIFHFSRCNHRQIKIHGVARVTQIKRTLSSKSRGKYLKSQKIVVPLNEFFF